MTDSTIRISHDTVTRQVIVTIHSADTSVSVECAPPQALEISRALIGHALNANGVEVDVV